MGINRGHHYVFAHKLMPSLLFADPVNFLTMFSADPQRFLLQQWKSVHNLLGTDVRYITPAGLSGEVRTLRGDTTIALITLPRPVFPPEAFFVAAVYRTHHDPLFTLVNFFALELSIPDDGKARTIFGEWTVLQDHKNYGDGGTPTVDRFWERVSEMVTKRLSGISVMDMGFGMVFYRSMIDAETDQVREEHIQTILDNKALNMRRLQSLRMENARMREEGIPGLEIGMKWSERLIHEYNRAHCQTFMRGVSIVSYMNDTLAFEYGNAFERGLYLIMESSEARQPAPEEMFARYLLERLGQDAVFKAFIEGESQMLEEHITAQLGFGTYIHLLNLSDHEQWDEVFSILKKS